MIRYSVVILAATALAFGERERGVLRSEDVRRCSVAVKRMVSSEPTNPSAPRDVPIYIRDSTMTLLLVRATPDTVLAGPSPEFEQRPSSPLFAKPAVYGQVMRAERMAGANADRLRGVTAARASSEIVVVPWGYDAACFPYYWHGTARWITPDSAGVVIAVLRPDSLWVGGRPTLDATFASIRSYAYGPDVLGPARTRLDKPGALTSSGPTPEQVFLRNVAGR
jgi:hypothetical protein